MEQHNVKSKTNYRQRLEKNIVMQKSKQTNKPNDDEDDDNDDDDDDDDNNNNNFINANRSSY
jgi:hypothetical protein